MKDKFLTFRDATYRALMGDNAITPPALRAAVVKGDPPPELTALVKKIRTAAYTVTDEDIYALRGRYNDDELFEIVVSAVYGTASDQLAAARKALEEA